MSTVLIGTVTCECDGGMALERAMQTSLLFASSIAIKIHVASALAAFLVGLVQLLGRKGTRNHRRLGWLWVGLMALTALSSFAIVDYRNPEPTALILLLSVFVLVQLPLAIHFARAGRIEAHRKTMIGMFIGALVVAGAFTMLPGRLMHRVLFG